VAQQKLNSNSSAKYTKKPPPKMKMASYQPLNSVTLSCSLCSSLIYIPGFSTNAFSDAYFLHNKVSPIQLI